MTTPTGDRRPGNTPAAAPASTAHVNGTPATAPHAGAPPPASGGGRIGTFHALRFHDFRLLWVGTVFASLGQWVQITTLGWVVYDLTGSSALLGAIGSMRAVPMLFFSPFAGVAADRMDRRVLLIWTQVAMLVLALVVGVALVFDVLEVWHLFVFTLLAGTAQVFNMPVRQTVIFDLVPRAATGNAIALMTSTFNFTQVLGPALAGPLLVSMGASGNFFIQSAAYLAVVVSLFYITIPAVKHSGRDRSMMKNMGDGFRYVAKEPMVRTLVLMGLINPLLLAPPLFSLMPVFAKDIFKTGSTGLGLLMAAMGAGGMLGGLFTASLGQFERRGVLQLGALLAMSVTTFAFSFMPTQWAAMPLLFLTGFSQMVYMTTNQMVVQLTVPDQMRGRVSSILMLNFALMPLGGIVAGTAAEVLGAPRVVTIMSGAAMVIAVAIVFLVPRVRELRMSQLVGTEEARGPRAAGAHGG